eukprot:936474_1
MSLTSTSVSSNQPLLTTTKLWAVFFVQLNEAYQITVLMPMVVFMCRDFGVEPRLLGIYTSILNASFCFCQFLCCYVWGLISDKYGRRKALVCGLIFSTIAILIFGLSKDFATALVARCVSGFFNGNLGVIKAYLADITDTTNRPWAFSILAISYGFGSVLGSMFGGILIVTNDVDVPWDQYQPTTGIIKFWIFEKQYPFLLPCLVGAIISFNALIWVLMFVHDEKVIYPRSLTQSTDYNTITSDLDSLVVSVLQDNSQRPNFFCCANLMVAICTASIIFVCSMCWLNNSVPNEYVGRANGLGQTGAALVRAIGPTMTGFIWSATVNDIEHNKLAVYYAYLPSFILCMFINTWIYLFITDDAQLVYEELQQKKRKQRRCFMHE